MAQAPSSIPQHTDRNEPIAVLGFAFQFPQEATDDRAFWELIRRGRTTSTEVPPDRTAVQSFRGSNADSLPVSGGNFLGRDVAAFDAAFFRTTTAEANGMDPQQRLLLESTYQALENAGLTLDHVAGQRASVHVGSSASDYAGIQNGDPLNPSKYAATGIAQSFLANRLSWFFGLTGPSLTIDTACSSSMTALDLSCRLLQSGDVSMGVVAGSNLSLAPYFTICMGHINALSPDNRSFSFDARANGYSRGEGVGTLILKRMSDAVRCGDPIRAVIRSTASNHDGRTPIATQPSKTAQELLIQETYARANLSPEDTTYCEAHATGTPVGDPIEMRAIANAFFPHGVRQLPLYMGGLKANIGHLEAASGIAAIIKAILMIEQGIIPPIADLQTLNPKIAVISANLKFPRDAIPWPEECPRRISINSFGIGGHNSHAIIEAPSKSIKLSATKAGPRIEKSPCSQQQGTTDGASHVLSKGAVSTPNGSHSNGNASLTRSSHHRLLVFSAADAAGIDRLASAHERYFDAVDQASVDGGHLLHDVEYTLSERRSRLPWRSFVVADPVDHWRFSRSALSKPVRAKQHLPLAFVFTGQGAQWTQMGRELLSYPSFRDSILDAGKHMVSLGASWILLDELCEPEKTSRINEPFLAQPLCTAMQIALVDLLHAWGISPNSVIGHSSGEIAAAYCTGAISRQSAWSLAYFRGSLTHNLSALTGYDGAMLAASIPAGAAQSRIDALRLNDPAVILSIGCVNGPNNVTISGKQESVDLLARQLEHERVFSKRLDVNVAYHSPQMSVMVKEYKHRVGKIACSKAPESTLKMVSSVTGQHAAAAELRDIDYWIRNLTSQVRFLDATSTLLKSHQFDAVVELGPHPALKSVFQETVASVKPDAKIEYLSALRRHQNSAKSLKELLGHLWSLGHPFNIAESLGADGNGAGKKQVLTDLPWYPFDHSTSYWHEGSLSRGYRFRRHARLELLGTPAADWNDLQPRWRNMLRVSELPWIADHKLNGTILCPGAGMLVMAIEAVRQLRDENRHVSGIRIKNAHFHNALAFATPDSEIETQFALHPLIEASGRPSSSQFSFRLDSLQNQKWRTTCDGSIEIEYHSTPNVIDCGKEQEELTSKLRRQFQEGYAACQTRKSSTEMYQSFQKHGFEYGPKFQCIESVAIGTEKNASVRVRIDQMELTNYSYIIHPGALDSILQLALVTTSKAGETITETHVATDVGELWISAGSQGDEEAPLADVFAQYDDHTGKCDMIATSDPKQTPRLFVKGFRTQAIAHVSSNATSSSQLGKGQGCYKQVFKPDITQLEPQDLRKYCLETRQPTTAEPVGLFKDFQLVALAHIFDLDNYAQHHNCNDMPAYVQSYLAWVRSRAQAFETGTLPLVDFGWRKLASDASIMAEKRKTVHSSGAQGRLLVDVGARSLDVIKGETKAMDLFFGGNLAKDYYQDGFKGAAFMEGTRRLFDLMGHKNPSMRILEIGAGTGSMTNEVLDTIGGDGSGLLNPRFGHYDFTDISRSFLVDAKRRFEKYGRTMAFNVLNIDSDPLAQGFEAQSYDLVIAASVLHATKDLASTVRNIHKVLKPGGKLLILEITQKDLLATPLVWGLLESWWSSTDDRQGGPCVSESVWNDLLSSNGFTGCETTLPDYDSVWGHWLTAIITTALPHMEEASKPDSLQHIRIIRDTASARQVSLAAELNKRFMREGHSSCSNGTLGELAASNNCEGSSAIFLLDTDACALADMDETTFEQLRSILLSSKSLLWVSGTHESREGFHGLIDGFMRTIRTEYEDLACTVLQLKQPNAPLDFSATIIVKAFASMHEHLPGRNWEREMSADTGILQVPRFVQDASVGRHIADSEMSAITKRTQVGDAPPFKIRIGRPGLLQSLHLEQNDDESEELKSDMIEIDTRAAGINFKDVLAAMGRINSAIGIETAGVVRRVGSAIKGLESGDRVVAIAESSFASLVQCHEDLVTKIPEAVSFQEAAGFAISGTTIVYALQETARLRAGESILIHSAAGATGQAAVQFAKHVGAKIYATVGSLEKRDFVRDEYGVPEDHIFFSRDETFLQGVMRVTCEKGVDVVLNSLSGPLLESSWRCVAPFGRFVEIGKRDILQRRRLPMEMFDKNVAFHAVDLSILASHRPKILQRCLQDAMRLAGAGRMSVSRPLQLYGLSEIETAFRHLQSGQSKGKLVLTMQTDEEIEVTVRKPVSLLFKSDATYMIVGAFGGIGRLLAFWMAGRGARHMLLLSRSGPKTLEAKALIERLEGLGVQVNSPQADVTDYEQLKFVFEQAKSMPPLRGCFQAAVVLKDAMFKDTNLQSWRAAVSPKLEGSYNLHRLLPTNIDFFVMLASGCGIIGNHGQSGYAAGNAFQDALARQRTRCGLKTVSLDLTLVDEIESTAVSRGQASRLRASNQLSAMTFQEVAALLELYCQPSAEPLTEADCQPILGMVPPADIIAQGGRPWQFYREPAWRQLWQINAAQLGAGSSSQGQDAARQQAEMIAKFAAASSAAEAGDVVATKLAKVIAAGLGVAPSEIDKDSRLHEYGVDSLVAVEIKHMLMDDFGADVAVFDIVGDTTTLKSLGSMVTKRSLVRKQHKSN